MTESANNTEKKPTTDPTPEPATELTTPVAEVPGDAPAATTDAPAGQTPSDAPAAETAGDETDAQEPAAAPVAAKPAGDPSKKDSSALLPGAAAIVATVFGFVSLTGTGLSDMLRARKDVIGQIEAGMGGGGGDQIEAVYSGPWHTAAAVNGVFALLAIATAAAAFLLTGRGTTGGTWPKAVATAGLIIGVVGLLVSAGMYFDLVGPAPTMPQQPPMQPGGGG